MALLPDLDNFDNWDAYLAMLDRTQGMFADGHDEFEEAINEARKVWDDEWQHHLNSL